jgi:hypothetical protein
VAVIVVASGAAIAHRHHHRRVRAGGVDREPAFTVE